MYATKYTLSWNKKRLQKKFGNFRSFVGFFVPNYSIFVARYWLFVFYEYICFPNGAPHAVWKNTVYFVTLRDKYTISWNRKVCKISQKFTVGFFVPTCSLFVAKCYKISGIFPNGVWATAMALLRMMGSGAGFRGGTLFWSKNR